MAQSRRAARRRAGDVGDTDLVDDVEHVEEDLAVDEEYGVKLEAFNLKEERQQGYFDEAGTYVENKNEDEDATDAWLTSDEAKVVDAATRRKIEEAEARRAEAEAAAPLTATQIARLQWQVARLLQPGETVARALKRLGGQGHAHRAGKRAKKAAASAEPARNPADNEKFDALTEAASTLMDSGETDVYTQDRGYFERSAAVYIDDDVDGGDGAGPSNFLARGVSKAAYEDADEDMFGDDGDEGKQEEKEKEGGGADGAAAPPPAQAKPEPDTTDYDSWPIKELRRYLAERGADAAGAVEKADLVARVREVAAAAPAARGDAKSGGGAVRAPPGYAFDPGSKMWFSQDSGMFWDPASGGFYNPQDSKWYSWANGSWVEWKTAS